MMSWIDTGIVFFLPYVVISTIGIPGFSSDLMNWSSILAIIFWIKFMVYLKNIYVLHLCAYLH
jgi:hypothetical protein